MATYSCLQEFNTAVEDWMCPMGLRFVANEVSEAEKQIAVCFSVCLAATNSTSSTKPSNSNQGHWKAVN